MSVSPGYQASTPWSTTLVTQARTASLIRPGGGPRTVFPRARRWFPSLLALVVQWATWSANVSFVSRKAPSHLVDWLGGLGFRPGRSITGSSSLFLVKNQTSIFFGLNGDPSDSPYSSSSVQSFLSFSYVMWMSLVIYIDLMSSAQPARLAPRFRTIGSTQRRKRIGESGEPCGRPPYGLAGCVSSPPYEILTSLLETKDQTHSSSHGGHPQSWSRPRSFIYVIMLKAPLISRKSAVINLPLSRASSTSEMKQETRSIAKRFGRALKWVFAAIW